MKRELQEKLAIIRVVVLDFDGTMTDGHAYVSQDGTEFVRCSRKDGLGIEMLKRSGLEVVVLSKETNPVVAARCRKLGIPCIQGVDDKLTVLERRYGHVLSRVLYMGDDINDLACIKTAGVGVTVADGHPECIRAADIVTERNGGDHAVREVCDLIVDAREGGKR